MLRSWKIARAFGVDIFVHWTFWILPVVFIYATEAYTPLTATFALVTLALFAVVIVMHEFGHIFMARVFGIRTKDVILTPLGGMARMERMSESPAEEILISLAGPAVNVVLAMVFFLLVMLLIGPTTLLQMSQSGPHAVASWQDLLVALLGVNVLMGAFNMLPAFPMDGGRVFRAILASITTRVRATTVAVYVGTVVIGLVGLYLFATKKSPLALPLAIFIAFIGHMELMMVKRTDHMRRRAAYVRRMQADACDAVEVIVPGLPPEPGFSGYSWNARAGAWIEWRDGNPVRVCRMRAG